MAERNEETLRPASRRLTATSTGEVVDLEDVLAAVRTSWLGAHPDDAQKPTTPSSIEQLATTNKQGDAHGTRK